MNVFFKFWFYIKIFTNYPPHFVKLYLNSDPCMYITNNNFIITKKSMKIRAVYTMHYRRLFLERFLNHKQWFLIFHVLIFFNIWIDIKNFTNVYFYMNIRSDSDLKLTLPIIWVKMCKVICIIKRAVSLRPSVRPSHPSVIIERENRSLNVINGE